MKSLEIRQGECRACGESVPVAFTDGAPMRDAEVMTLEPLNGDPVLILHNGCELGDEYEPRIIFAEEPKRERL